VVHEINASGERNHSVHLIPIIEQALQASGTVGSSLSGISVGIGPGSYTGTRIAVSAAKTLAWAWNVPVVGVSTLHALAWGGFMKGSEGHATRSESQSPDWIIPLLDARRGQAYTAIFAANGTLCPENLAPDAIRLMQDWVQQLVQLLQQAEAEGNKPPCLWFVGETALHASEESLAPLEEITSIRVVSYELEGRWTGFLGEQRHSHGSDDIHSLIPNYTQLSEAEANLRKNTEGGSK